MSEEMFRSMAASLARCPEVLPRLREAHLPDPDGRCTGCTSQVRPATRWPCALAVIAAMAPSPRADRVPRSGRGACEEPKRRA